jgi:Sulfotransferase family
MIISHKYKFIFIHNPKVAGASIASSLKKYGLKNAVHNKSLAIVLNSCGLTGYYANNMLRRIPLVGHFKHHDTALKIKERWPEKTWSMYFKFGFVRNTWDWQVSLYHFIKKMKWHHLHEEVIKCENFNNYINSGLFKQEPHQLNYFTNIDKEIIVDFIGKIENFEDDLNKIKKHLKIDFHVPHINTSSHKNYQEYYNEETMLAVKNAYRQDIEMFNYKFENIK